MSWGLDAVVLHVLYAGGEEIVKAAGPGNHHIAREINAHERWTRPWVTTGRVGRLRHADRDHNVTALSYLPGVLVQGTSAVNDPDTYRQAGELLAAFHSQASRVSGTYEARMDARALGWLDGAHRILPGAEAQLRPRIGSPDRPPVALVPTHGDWQARNWLIDDGRIMVIDLGRSEWCPAIHRHRASGASRVERPSELDRAFVEGYGADLREPAASQRTLRREAVGTACWAYQVGDEALSNKPPDDLHDAERGGWIAVMPP